ncbi:hypothetical protein VTL71DRAFT_16426 [Oculimacula yallundae]|uniref:Uncharacterized protein n=1 Tax=Oculimacula yallundae TaxID=86028 RepID=A0ABR4CEF6_9HELO
MNREPHFEYISPIDLLWSAPVSPVRPYSRPQPRSVPQSLTKKRKDSPYIDNLVNKVITLTRRLAVATPLLSSPLLTKTQLANHCANRPIDQAPDQTITSNTRPPGSRQSAATCTLPSSLLSNSITPHDSCDKQNREGHRIYEPIRVNLPSIDRRSKDSS